MNMLIFQVYIDAPHAATGPVPDDVKGRFDGPYFQWFVANKAVSDLRLVSILSLAMHNTTTFRSACNNHAWALSCHKCIWAFPM